MKVQPPVSTPQASKPAKPASEPGQDKRASKFSKTLEAKAAQAKPGKTGGPEEVPAAAAPWNPALRLEAGGTEETKAASPARTIEAIGHEIQVRLSSDVREVSIQFDSKVLDGLHVRIRKEGGAISIQFAASTTQAYDTVSAGAGQLQAALQLKGIPVTAIRVHAAAAAMAEDSRPGGRHGDGQSRGRGGDGRRR
jgi:flagellar hook-length control protein FliK